jgi:D-alanyl-D-alanine carboxypeptidase
LRRAVLFLAVCLTAAGLTAPRAEAVSTSAASAILMDADSGRVLYEQNADEPRLIASITKLMTALVAVEEMGDLSQTVTVQGQWLNTEGSSVYLQAGEEITLEALLYGLLLESGNDAAMVIACACAGSAESFAALMNEKAQALGMTGSHFVNPSGLNADEHYSTARDMAVLAAACLENETVAKICATSSATFGTRTFVNHNRLLSLYDGCVGMKTGYTQRAGRTLVSAARRDGQTLIVVTLNDPDDWKDHMALLDYGFETYPSQELSRAGETVSSIPVQGSLVPSVEVVTAEGFCYPLKEGEQVQTRAELADQAEAPVLAGQSAGRLVYELGGQEIGAVELCYAQTVNRDTVPELSTLQRILSAIFGRTVTVFGHGSELVSSQ